MKSAKHSPYIYSYSAVDGYIDSCTWSYTNDQNDNQAWWYVDLLSKHVIFNVTLFDYLSEDGE